LDALVISNRFNPGHFSHLIAIYKLLKSLKLEPCLLINKRFNAMNLGNQFCYLNNTNKINFRLLKVTLFCFPSIKNIWLCILIKLFSNAKIIYIFHEPIGSISSFKQAGFNFSQIIRILIVKYINIVNVVLADHIIVPSKKAYDEYANNYTFFNNSYTKIPLFFDDELTSQISIEQKVYISYIGTIAPDHAFNAFLNFVKNSFDNIKFNNLKYLIATSSKIDISELEELKPLIDSGNLIVCAGSYLSNEEINDFYLKSIIVWNAYNRSMQSGVLVKSYMFGTPVIGLVNVSNEYVENKSTGVLITDNNNYAEIAKAISEILANRVFYINNARKYFLNQFYYKNYINNFKFILDKWKM